MGVSTISKGNTNYRKSGTLSAGTLRQGPLAPLLLGIMFFFAVCLSAVDSMPVLIMIVAVFMFAVMAVRFGVLRERFCIPVLALTLYVIMDGVSTFYALSGKFALREFLKVFLAFALAVIMLAASPKKEEQSGRSIATILAVCAALGSLVSIDMFSTRIISGSVFWLLGHFTEAYNNLTAVVEGNRMISMFVNPNPYAGFAGIGVLLSLGLAVTATSRKERCVALVLLYITSLGFLLAFSMGATIFIALAFLVFLALEKEHRVGLFLLMLETVILVGISTALIAATSFRNTEEIQLIPLVCALLGAAALCLLDVFAVSKAAEKLQSHGKLVWIVILVLIMLLVVFALVAWNWTNGVTLAPGESLKRSAYPSPGEYTLDIQADGQITVSVYSQSARQAMVTQSTALYDGDASTAHITVPEDSKVVYFTFLAPEGATIHSASVGGEKIPLHYQLLPSFIANRLQGLWVSQSALMRLSHYEDGMKLFKRSPIIGLGVGSFENAIKSVQSFYFETKYVHSHYIQALLDTGIIGLVLFLALLISNAIAIWKARKRQIFAPALGATLVFMAGHATMEIDFCSNYFLAMAFGAFALISLCCGDAIEKPTLSKISKTVCLGVIVACTIVYCFFITGNLSAKQYIKRNSSLQSLVHCVDQDYFEWADYALPYVIYAMEENTPPSVRHQADVFAERLAKVNSNTIPIHLAEYYFRTERPEQAVAMVEKYVNYLASDQDAWNRSFDLLQEYESDVEAFHSGVLRIADRLDAWNTENAGTITLDEDALAFIEKYRQ